MKIQYSVISRGTEKSGSKGYMAITKPINNNRYLIPIDHDIRECNNLKDALICYDYSISNIILSRFELISALSLEKAKFEDNVLICGLGNIGISTLIYLLDNKYKEITIYIRKNSNCIKKVINELNQKYIIKINIINKIEDNYNTYIDTTGSSEVIKNIFENIGCNKTIFLIGTPRESNFLIDPLLIHRNNLVVIGGHELRGITLEHRNELYKHLLELNKDKLFIENLITYNKYSKETLLSKLDNKTNFIEVFKYED